MPSQAQRHLAILVDAGAKGKSDGVGQDDILLLRKIQGHSGISQLYQYDLEMLSSSADLAGTDVLGKNATITIKDHAHSIKQYINGTIVRFALCGKVLKDTGDNTFYLYRAQLVPDLFKLTQTRRSRTFVNMDVKEIIAKVLSHAQSDSFKSALRTQNDTSKLGAFYDKYACCVQYQESDYDFICRLLERDGISFYFEHGNGTHKIVFTDNNSDFPQYPENGGAISFDFTQMREGIFNFTRDDSYVPFETSTYPKARDYDYRLAAGANHGLTGDSSEAHSLFEVYPSQARFMQQEGQGAGFSTRTEQLLRQNTMSSSHTWSGESQLTNIISGQRISLNNFPSAGANLALLLADVELMATAQYDLSNINGMNMSDYDDNFECSFTARNGNDIYRPAQHTPKPKIYGLQTGTVLTSTNDQAKISATSTDKYGRVKVKMHWQDKTNGSDDFCWARVGQMRAQAAYGDLTLPRAGEEVLVSFVNGDPDEPLVVGSVYNAKNLPPIDLESDQKMSSTVMRTRTLDDGEMLPSQAISQHQPVDKIEMSDLKDASKKKGFNEISSIDTKDEQRIGIYSNQNILAQAPDEITVNAGKKLRIEAGEQIELIVGNSRLSIKPESIDLGVTGKMDLEILPLIWSERVPGTGTYLHMNPNGAKISGEEVKIQGWMGASMASLYSSVKVELLTVGIGAHGIDMQSGFFLTNVATPISYISGITGKGDEGSEATQGWLKTLTTLGAVSSMFSLVTGLGSSVCSMTGGEVKHMAGYMSIPVLGEAPMPGLGKLEQKSSGDAETESFLTWLKRTLNEKKETIESGATTVKNGLTTLKDKIVALSKSKDTVDEDANSIEMQDMSVSKESSSVETTKESVSEETTGVEIEMTTISKTDTTVENEETNVSKTVTSALEDHL